MDNAKVDDTSNISTHGGNPVPEGGMSSPMPKINTAYGSPAGFKGSPGSPDSGGTYIMTSPNGNIDSFADNNCNGDGDDDDDLTYSSLSTLDEMAQDLRFAFPSDLLFFIGSALSVALAVTDLNNGEYYYSEEYYAAYYADKGASGDTGGNAADMAGATAADDESSGLDSYTIISMAAALCFIINPIVDISRVIHYKRDAKMSWCHKDLRYDLTSSLLFGMAASIDLWASMPKYEYEDEMLARAGQFSSHIYLLSAVSAMLGTDWNCCNRWLFFVTFIGNMLFCTGSIIDVGISYVADPHFVMEDYTILLKLGILSSSLWLTNSVLNLFVDFTLLRLQKCPRNEKKAVPLSVNVGLDDTPVTQLEIL